MTTLNAVQNGIDAIVRVMMDRGLVKPRANYTVNANGKGGVYLAWEKRDLGSRYSPDNHEGKFFNDDEPADSLGPAREWVDALPSKAERDRATFMEQLAETIETGKRAGIEDGFVNPLLDMMKKLSENALTGPAE